MKALILMGSPRKGGNTASLTAPFVEELKADGVECTTFDVYDMDLRPCVACRTCQKDWTIFGCPQDDDMQQIFDAAMEADLIVAASPIYSWYCTPPMKNALDRLVYGMNKYYGEEMGPSIWKGKKMALISTCGYPVEKGADRLVYGMNKYYGEEMGPSIWKGKKMALISTCGYPVEKGADLWEEGMKRYAKHSRLQYVGMVCERQRNYGEQFMDEEKEAKMRAFAKQCIEG